MFSKEDTVNPVLSGHSKRRPLVFKTDYRFFKTDYRLMEVNNSAECSREHSAIRSTFLSYHLSLTPL